MLFAAHLIVGGTVGQLIGNPIVAFIVGIISHFILDHIPHTDHSRNKSHIREAIFLIFDLTLFFAFWAYYQPHLTSSI